jgi:putative ABC transport system permease protein
MFKNYFITAVRILSRNKKYAAVNLAGLSAGIAVCLLIYVFIRFETGFDNFHSNEDRIFRVLTEYHHGNDVFYGSAVPLPLPATLKHDFPEVKYSTGIFSSSDDQVFVLDKSGQTLKKFREKTGIFNVDPAFFNIFDFKWLAGDPATSLEDRNSAVLSRGTAEKYFGNWKEAMGKTINLNHFIVMKITGILENPPANTDFQFRIVIPYSLSGNSTTSDWNTASDRHGCYILLPPAETEASFTRRLRFFAKKYRPQNNTDEYVLQPLSQVHFNDGHRQISNFIGKTISPELIRALWIIAALILGIACVNFINLSTVQALNRAGEIGVRKVFGSRSGHIRAQFLVETLIIVIPALIVAISITLGVIGPLGRILDTRLSTDFFLDPTTYLFLACILFLVTLIAGSYPSLVISRLNPINAMRSKKAARSKKGISLRRGLVIFQFMIAQSLIIAMVIMIRQMNYFRNGSMGFDKDAIVTVPLPYDSSGVRNIDFLRNKLGGMPGISEISFSNNPPATNDINWSDFQFDHGEKGKGMWAISKFADTKYLRLYNLELLAGRTFSSDTAREFLVTEKMAHMLGISNAADIINKQLDLGGGWIKGPIVGVLKDFHSTGFKDEYSPVFVVPFKPYCNMAAIKLTSVQVESALKGIASLWDTTFPNFIFEYRFLDDAIADFYKQEDQQTQIYKILTGIAIFLSCLGLYGLVSLLAVQRIREVGIRKVLGASVKNITYLFVREFAILIGMAFLIAAPVAWYFMHQWLQNYAYRTDLSWWIFFASGLLSLLVAMATISSIAIRAAVTNPAIALRTE